MTRRPFLLLAAAAMVVAGCSGDVPEESTTSVVVGSTPATASDDTAASATTGPASATIDWQDYADNVEIGMLEVPLDYDDPDGRRIELRVARFNALAPGDRIGSLLVNPGGPGGAGSQWAINAATRYDRTLLERFDIIGFDPRGVGASEPSIDCVDDFDPYFTAADSTPADDAAHRRFLERAAEFTAACVDHSDGILAHVGTANAARDMDAIRRALDEETISYFGFSYGSELGAVWATLFPDTVRAAVFDGAVDPGADSLQATVNQYEGFHDSFESFLERCDTDRCQFAEPGAAEETYLDLLADLDAAPLAVDEDRPPVNRDVALSATFQAMYSEQYWDLLDRSLADAIDGDGSGLLQLHDNYYRRSPEGEYPNLIEAFHMISCADRPDRKSAGELAEEVARLREVAPLLVPKGTVSVDYCEGVPEPDEPPIEVTADGAPPIVVIGTTGDPSTPLSSTEAMANSLSDGRLVVVLADQHTGYGVNDCVIDVVNEYLVELEAPDPGTVCGDVAALTATTAP